VDAGKNDSLNIRRRKLVPKGVYVRTQYYKDLLRQRQGTKEYKIKHSQDCKGKCGVYKRTEEQKMILRENGKKYGFKKENKIGHRFKKGYKWTKKHRENHKKYKMTEHHKSLCGQYKRTENHLNLLRELNSGEKNHGWKGGISLDKKKYNQKYQQNIPKEERNVYRREYNHRLGISKKYSYKYGGLKPLTKREHRLLRKYNEKEAGELTIETIQKVYEDNIKEFQTLTCYLCLEPIIFGKDTLDHIIPLSRGGTNKYENLAIACRICNSVKHNKLIEEL